MKRIILTSAITATLLFMGIPTMSAAESATSTTKASESRITAVTDAEPTVKINSGNLEISVPDDTIYNFNIYSITGQLVKTLKLSDGTASVELPRGCYIVKCEKWSKKIVIR